MTTDQVLTDFEGRTAFVTGGARGIGRGIVKALLRRGARVGVADISVDALEQLREDLGADTGRLGCYQLDVADRARYAEAASAVQAELGDVTLLFNNAGVIDSVSPTKLSYAMWDHVMGINLEGVYNGVQSFLPGMIASEQRCHIVNTSSEAGLLEAGSGFLYHASKYAVVGLSEALRRELAHFQIGVSVLFPGPVATDIVQNTRGLRPTSAPAQSSRVTQILDTAHEVLKAQGASPDAVGELVLEGVETDAAYIATRSELLPYLRLRTEAVGAAMTHADEFLACQSTRA
ncbi:SDR family NAD(P)-dependent oxidoreductase [Sphaerisporangium sp. NPDC051017]|uniref:SDR family oxidoreductase n=1 Tax=Sphaerisporangium sp. NPDC051017 TaxID=3154636 RepID=UPI0034433AEA